MNRDTHSDWAPDERELARRYRESATELPPAHVDAAIRAAARREVNAGPRSRTKSAFGRHWMIPATTAATLVLGIGLIGVMRDSAPPLRQADESVSLRAPRQDIAAEPVTKAPKAARSFASTRDGDAAPKAEDSAAEAKRGRAAASSREQSADAFESELRKESPPAALTRQIPSPPSEIDEVSHTPEAMVARIEQLLDEGRAADALSIWKDMQLRFPDFAVGTELRDRLEAIEEAGN